jgi:putative membrane protein
MQICRRARLNFSPVAVWASGVMFFVGSVDATRFPNKNRSARNKGRGRNSMKTIHRATKLASVLGVASLALIVAAPLAGSAQTAVQHGQLNHKDYRFAAKAARIDMEEVQAGELAQKSGVNPLVRQFGERMITDHNKLNTGLKKIAADKGAILPTQLTEEQSSALRHLEGLSGAEFDRAFAEAMVKGHTQAVKTFQEASKNVTDTELRTWAQTALPVLQEHLRLAQEMEAAVRTRAAK